MIKSNSSRISILQLVSVSMRSHTDGVRVAPTIAVVSYKSLSCDLIFNGSGSPDINQCINQRNVVSVSKPPVLHELNA